MTKPEIIISPAVRESATLWPLVERANSTLFDVLSKHPEPVTAEWERSMNVDGKEVLLLTMRDDVSATRGLFAPKDFDEQRWLRYDMRDILIRLLSRRTRHYLQSAVATNGEEG